MALIQEAVGRNQPFVKVQSPPILAQRAPAVTDTNYAKGRMWLDESVSPAVLYDHLGSGTWAAGGNANASTTVRGIVVLDDDLATAASDTVPTSAATKSYADAIAVAGGTVATTIASGVGRLVSDANAVAQIPSTALQAYFVQPSNIAAIMAAPGAIGGTTPAAGAFTTLAATGAVDFDAGGSWESGAATINIGADVSADAINLGTGAAARVITIGNVTGATSVSINAGTGNFALEGDVATTYNISATGANTGTVTIAAGTGARTVNLATGGTGVKTVNIATAAIGNIVTIGTVTAAASLDLLCGTGNFTLEGATASTYSISAVGANSGTITIGAGTGTQSLDLMTGGTGVKTVNIGTGAIGNVITIGTVTAAASLDLLCGTGNFTLEGNVASTYDISSTGANTGTVTIASGTGARIVELAGGGTGIKTINIGTGATADVITIGTATGAGSLDLVCGSGDFTCEGSTGATYEISSTGVNTGTCKFASGTGARIVEIAGGGTGAKTINIGAAASADLITIGDATGAGSLDLVCGTGDFTLEGATGADYSISETGVNTGTVSIGGGTGARVVNLGVGGTGAKTVNIATAAIGNLVTIGSVTAAASLDLLCGTGNFTLEGATASTYDISSTGINTGTVTIGSGTGARIVELAGGGTGIKTINIGAAATADVITIGTTTAAGSLTLAAGTGDITMSGTVKEINAEFLFSSGTDLTVTQSPIMQTALSAGTAPTGVDGDVNLMYLQDGCLMEQFIIGTQTILAPRMSATGLDIELDNTNAEGVEYNFGALASAKHAYTIGTSAAFFFEAQITVEDLSGCSPLMIGFRKVEANNKVLGNYTDYFCAGLNTGTSITEVILLNELNSTGQTITNSTDIWTGGDAGTTTIRVLVSAAGVCTYTIDGGAPSATNAMTFDGTDVVMPFIHFLNGADVAGAVSLNSFKCGFQA